jgi:4-hydroxy-3-methylbut-2-enyl diphosphate reductase
MSTRPLFLAPLRLEASAIRRGARGAEIERVGMGPANAASACARLGVSVPEGRPVILAGVAGGLVDGLQAGDVVVASAIAGSDDAADLLLPDAPSVAAALEAAGLSPRLVPVYSSEKILHGRAPRLAAAAGGSAVVEMEARWLTPLGHRRPFVVVRVVLDTLEDELASLSTPRNAARAYRALRDCAAALADWTPDPLAPINLSDPLTRSN